MLIGYDLGLKCLGYVFERGEILGINFTEMMSSNTKSNMSVGKSNMSSGSGEYKDGGSGSGGDGDDYGVNCKVPFTCMGRNVNQVSKVCYIHCVVRLSLSLSLSTSSCLGVLHKHKPHNTNTQQTHTHTHTNANIHTHQDSQTPNLLSSMGKVQTQNGTHVKSNQLYHYGNGWEVCVCLRSVCVYCVLGEI